MITAELSSNTTLKVTKTKQKIHVVHPDDCFLVLEAPCAKCKATDYKCFEFASDDNYELRFQLLATLHLLLLTAELYNQQTSFVEKRQIINWLYHSISLSLQLYVTT